MAEYVDKVKLMSRIESELMRWGESEYNALQILGDIEDFPSADVVEVVRCSKCKHGDASILSKTIDGEEVVGCYCNLKKVVTNIDSYCPSGRKK